MNSKHAIQFEETLAINHYFDNLTFISLRVLICFCSIRVAVILFFSILVPFMQLGCISWRSSFVKIVHPLTCPEVWRAIPTKWCQILYFDRKRRSKCQSKYYFDRYFWSKCRSKYILTENFGQKVGQIFWPIGQKIISTNVFPTDGFRSKFRSKWPISVKILCFFGQNFGQNQLLIL